MKRFVTVKSQSKKQANWIQVSVLIALLNLLLSVNSFAQNAATATWALTSNGNPSVSGAITASNLALGSTLSSASYSSGVGVTSSGWSNDASSLRTNEYYEYTVTPNANTSFTVTSITGEHSRTSGDWRVAIFYSTDNFASSRRVGSEFNINSTTSTAFSRTGLSYIVNPGTTFSIRIYAWESDGSGRSYRNRNIVISGTTCAVSSIGSINGVSSICASSTTNFTANNVVLGVGTGSWSSSNTAVATVNSVTGEVSAIAAGTTNIIYTITGGCNGTQTSSKELIVNPLPTAITATVNNATICRGASVTLGGPSFASGATQNFGLQNFEGSGSTMSYSKSGDGGTKSGTTSTSDRPSNISYATSGTEGFWVNDGTSTLTFANVTNLPNNIDKKVSFKLAALSVGSSSNGVDGGDFVHVEISLNNGTTWSREATINGNSNAFWGYSTGTATAEVDYDGNNTATVFAPSGGGNRTTDGYSTVIINLPVNATQARIRIVLDNNSGNEAWVIDDVMITGNYANYTWSSNPVGFTSTAQSPIATPNTTTTYTLTTTNGLCSLSSDVTVTVNTTEAPKSTAQTFCGAATVANLTATGTNIKWYSTATSSTALATTTTLATGNYFASQTENGCESNTRVTVPVTINDLPTAPTAAATQTFCNGSTVNNLVATGNTIKWYNASTGGDTIASNTALNATNYFATQTVNGCESATRTLVSVSLNPTPNTTNATICAGATGVLTVTSLCEPQGSTTTGAVAAGSTSNNTTIGNRAWSNLNNALNGFANVTLQNNSAVSNYFVASNFNFSQIPANAIIKGIRVSISKYATSFGGIVVIEDNQIRLVKNGTIVGDNKANSTSWSANAQNTTNYGSASDLWGTTWTVADLQNSNFGFALSARNNTIINNSYVAYVGNISITVNYIIPGSINWYTTATGGTAIGSGNSFNPAGITNSGLANTFTPSTTTYYAECSYYPGCRSAADFIITPGVGTVNGGGTICSSTNTSTLSLTGNIAGNVQWQSSTDSTNFNNINGATQTNYTATNLSATTYFRAVITPSVGACGILQSPIATLQHYATGSWIGNVSNNWDDPNNWCGGIPDSTTDVVIYPSNNAPVVNNNASVKNITVQNSASLSVSPGKNLNVSGNINAVGKINNSPNSTLILNGTTTQVIPTITYANVINRNVKAAVFSNGDVTVTGTFTTEANTVTDLGASKLIASNIHNRGTLKLSGTNGDELPIGATWGGIVEYNNATATQIIVPGSYEKLRITGAGKNITAPISVTAQLELVSGTLNNTTNNVVVANGGTIVRMNGNLAAAPVFGNAQNSKVNIEFSGVDTVESGNELLGTTGKIGNIKINSGSYKLQHNITADDITVVAGAELDVANNTISSTKNNQQITINGTIKTNNPNGLIGTTNASFNASNNTIFDFTNSTVEYYASENQTISSREDYNNVTIKGGSNKLLNGNTKVNGVFNLVNSNDVVSIANNTLTLNGTVTGAGRLRGSANASIAIEGTGSLGTLLFDQTTDNTTNTLKSFTYNRANGNITLGNKLIIQDEVIPTNGTLNTNNNLTLRSTAQNTARIGRGNDAGNYINGEVTFERHITANANRAWRMVTPGVTTTTTINANWQEGKVNTIVNTNVPANTPGYGVHITGAGGSTNGFDVTQTNAASLYRFDQTAQSWALITNTNVNTLNAKQGYLLFVRGSRDNISPINTTTGSSNVTLRARGTLLQGTQTFSNLASNGGYSLVTNPFAAPVSWASIYASIDTSLFDKQVIIWDPNIGSRGGFVSILDDNTISNGASNLDINIQSGQAFFIKSRPNAIAPSFTIKEEHKTSTNNLDVFRSNTQIAKLKIQLRYTASNVDRSADGVTVVYASNYSNAVDHNDALQMANWDEDIALLRDGKELSIESRNLITANDTLFLKITNLKAAQANYRWVIQPEYLNVPGFTAVIEDAFTNTATPISLTTATTISFSVSSNAASMTSNRFRIVFRATAALPVTITQFKAQQKNNHVQLLWNTANELNIDRYEVEKSTNGQQFTAIAKIISNSNNSSNTYEMSDVNVSTGTMYYKLKIIEKDGSYSYSKVVTINIGKSGTSDFAIYPNPVKGNQIGLQLNNVEKGNYTVRLINNIGQVVYQSSQYINGNNGNEKITLSSTIPAGQYQLEISNGKGIRMLQNLIKE